MTRNSLLLGVFFALSACSSSQVAESDPAGMRNRAEALQRGADATTDDLVRQIDAEAAASVGDDGNQAGKN